MPRRPINATRTRAPDVVIMDISMPGRGGIDAIEHIRRFDAHARILVFTMHGGAVYALQAFRAGAKGYVTKSSPPDLLISAVRRRCRRPGGHLSGDQRGARARSRARGKDGTGGSFAARVRDLAHDPRREIDGRDRVGTQCQPQDGGATTTTASSRSSAWLPTSSCSISACGKGWSGPFRRRRRWGIRAGLFPVDAAPSSACRHLLPVRTGRSALSVLHGP